MQRWRRGGGDGDGLEVHHRCRGLNFVSKFTDARDSTKHTPFISSKRGGVGIKDTIIAQPPLAPRRWQRDPGDNYSPINPDLRIHQGFTTPIDTFCRF